MATKITTRRLQKYAALAVDQSEAERRLELVLETQRKFCMERLKALSAVGRSVTRKVLSQDTWRSKEALGELRWLMGSLTHRSFTTYGIEVKVAWSSDSGEVTIPARYLSMSDREFAKLIRRRLWTWKNHQKELARQKLAEDVRAKRKIVDEAKKELELLEAQLKNLSH